MAFLAANLELDGGIPLMNRICKRHPPPSGSTEAARLPEDCAELRSLYRSALIPAREGGLFAHNSQNLRAKAMPTPSAALSIILPLGPIVGKASQKKSCLSRIAKGRPICGDPKSCLMEGMATSTVRRRVAILVLRPFTIRYRMDRKRRYVHAFGP